MTGATLPPVAVPLEPCVSCHGSIRHRYSFGSIARPCATSPRAVIHSLGCSRRAGDRVSNKNSAKPALPTFTYARCYCDTRYLSSRLCGVPKLVAAQRRRHKRKALRFSHICAVRNVSPFFLRFLFFTMTIRARDVLGGSQFWTRRWASWRGMSHIYIYISRARLEQCLLLGVASLSSRAREMQECTLCARIERATVDPAISARIRDISNGCCFFLSLASVREGVSDPEANTRCICAIYARTAVQFDVRECASRSMCIGTRIAYRYTLCVTFAQSELAAVQRCASSTGVIGGTRSSGSGNSDGAAAAMWRAGDDLVMTSRTVSCYAHGSSLNYANVLNSRVEVGCFRALLVVAREYVDSHAQVFARITIVLYFDECHLPYNKLLAILNGVIKINHIESLFGARRDSSSGSIEFLKCNDRATEKEQAKFVASTARESCPDRTGEEESEPRGATYVWPALSARPTEVDACASCDNHAFGPSCESCVYDNPAYIRCLQAREILSKLRQRRRAAVQKRKKKERRERRRYLIARCARVVIKYPTYIAYARVMKSHRRHALPLCVARFIDQSFCARAKLYARAFSRRRRRQRVHARAILHSNNNARRVRSSVKRTISRALVSERPTVRYGCTILGSCAGLDNQSCSRSNDESMFPASSSFASLRRELRLFARPRLIFFPVYAGTLYVWITRVAGSGCVRELFRRGKSRRIMGDVVIAARRIIHHTRAQASELATRTRIRIRGEMHTSAQVLLAALRTSYRRQDATRRRGQRDVHSAHHCCSESYQPRGLSYIYPHTRSLGSLALDYIFRYIDACTSRVVFVAAALSEWKRHDDDDDVVYGKLKA
ncbi:unnamed protein product, partial [Trichogramma brassicae]